MSMLNTSFEKIYKIFDINISIQVCTILVPVFAFPGAFIGGIMSKTGRMSGLVICDIISILGISFYLLAFKAGKYAETFFVVGRIICGLSSGINEVLMMLYIKEMSPDAICKKTGDENVIPMYTKKNLAEMSGKTGIFIQLFITIGALATSIMGLYLPKENY